MNVALGLAIVLGGCQPTAPEPTPRPEELRRLMRGNVADAKPAPPRLGRLAGYDLSPRFQGRPSCRLVHGADTLLIARDGAGLARVDGRLLAIPQAGPVDASGAFFRAPGVSISIGGRDPRLSSGPAGVTITGEGDDPPQRLEAVWSCTT